MIVTRNMRISRFITYPQGLCGTGHGVALIVLIVLTLIFNILYYVGYYVSRDCVVYGNNYYLCCNKDVMIGCLDNYSLSCISIGYLNITIGVLYPFYLILLLVWNNLSFITVTFTAYYLIPNIKKAYDQFESQ